MIEQTTTDRDEMTFLDGPGWMIVSTLLFGYFGFVQLHNTSATPAGQIIVFWAMLEWTLKIGAVCFGVAAAMTFKNRLAGNVLYTLTSMACGGLFVFVVILDLMDPQHGSVVPPFIMVIFAGMSCYGAWQGFQAIRLVRMRRRADST